MNAEHPAGMVRNDAAILQHAVGGTAPSIAAAGPPVRMAPAVRFQLLYPGVLAAGTTGLAATWLAQHYSAPTTLFALLFGIAFHFLHEDGRCRAGIEFCATTVLRAGVALLGVRITFDTIAGLGLFPIVAVGIGVTTTIGFGLLAARALRMPFGFGLQSGAAVGICGASAALAIASVLPASPERERDTIYTVVAVTALSTLAMVIYPVLVDRLGMSGHQSGIFLGATIHDVAQVVGAGYGVSTETGDVATYVKLLRVATLLPVVLLVAVSVRVRRSPAEVGDPAALPLFLLPFALLVCLGSTHIIPDGMIQNMIGVSRWCLVTAIAALGMRTSFARLAAVGLRPALLIVAETIWIAGLSLALLYLFG